MVGNVCCLVVEAAVVGSPGASEGATGAFGEGTGVGVLLSHDGLAADAMATAAAKKIVKSFIVCKCGGKMKSESIAQVGPWRKKATDGIHKDQLVSRIRPVDRNRRWLNIEGLATCSVKVHINITMNMIIIQAKDGLRTTRATWIRSRYI